MPQAWLRHKKLLLTTATTLTLAVFFLGIAISDPLPVMRLRNDGSARDGIIGGYCWKKRFDLLGLIGQCVSIVPDLNAHGPILLRRDERSSIEVEADRPPTKLTLIVEKFPATNYEPLKTMSPRPAFNIPLPTDLPPGLYTIDVFGEWPQGDVSYLFKVEIK